MKHSISPASRAISPSIRDAQLSGLPVLTFETYDNNCFHRYALVLDSGWHPTGPPEWIETIVSNSPHANRLELVLSTRCDAGQITGRLWDNDYVDEGHPTPADTYISFYRTLSPFESSSNPRATRFDLVPMQWAHAKPIWFAPGVGFSLCAASGRAAIVWCKKVRNGAGSDTDGERWIYVYDFNDEGC